jgi:hypothetical protein
VRLLVKKTREEGISSVAVCSATFYETKPFGYVPLNPGDFHVYDRRRRDITFGVPASLEAL